MEAHRLKEMGKTVQSQKQLAHEALEVKEEGLTLLNITGDYFDIEKAEYGCFLRLKSDEGFYDQSFELGRIEHLVKFTSCFRFNACWMIPRMGSTHDEIPEETQYLLGSDSKKFIMLFPLVDKYSRSSIYGSDDKLYVLVETGDKKTLVKEALTLYAIEGTDPYDMVKIASKEIVEKLMTCELRKNKNVPKYVNLLGFCTYNAFYEHVTHDKIMQMLKAFKENDTQIGFIIVDAGWQTSDGNYNAGFAADSQKFPNGIAETVKEAKEKYGVKELLVWHAYNGFWCGVKEDSYPDYEVEMLDFYIPQRLYKLMDKLEEENDSATAGMNFYPKNILVDKSGIIKNDLFRFYFDYYSYLRKQGVDGTKLDAVCWIECFGQNKGGRVRMMQQLVSGLEASSYLNFNGDHINCSCCSNDFIYNTLKSNVTRTSTDYFPNIPETHGMHIFTNAHTSFWMGELLLPDWDMFQTGNTAGEFHAMSRAISGGPVYCTDEMDKQRFDIIKKLCTKDARVGLCTDTARVTLSCMFTEPAKENVPIKIFNSNKHGYVLGAFNCSYKKDENVQVKGKGSVSDVYQIKGEKFAVYSSKKGFMGIYDENMEWNIVLGEFEAEIFTICPIENGYAVIGMTEKYNPMGFVSNVELKDGTVYIEMLEKGELLIYMENEPRYVPEKYTYDNHIMKINSESANLFVKL